jgi:hypothetical protein
MPYGRARVGHKRRTRLEAELGIRAGRSLKQGHISRLTALYERKLVAFEERAKSEGGTRKLLDDLVAFRRTCRLSKFRHKSRGLTLYLQGERDNDRLKRYNIYYTQAEPQQCTTM